MALFSLMLRALLFKKFPSSSASDSLSLTGRMGSDAGRFCTLFFGGNLRATFSVWERRGLLTASGSASMESLSESTFWQGKAVPNQQFSLHHSTSHCSTVLSKDEANKQCYVVHIVSLLLLTIALISSLKFLSSKLLRVSSSEGTSDALALRGETLVGFKIFL